MKRSVQKREEKIVSEPPPLASQALLDLVRDKQREVEDTLRTRQQSADMVKKLHQLSQGIQALTDNSSSVRHTLENWDHVFNTMAELNLQQGKHNSTWVRFDK